jgi:hypothetical protein
MKVKEERMSYTKPELVVAAGALEVIQCHSCKINGTVADGEQRDATAEAYEVDE